MRKLLVIAVRKISLLTGRDLYQTQADFGVQVVEGLGERREKKSTETTKQQTGQNTSCMRVNVNLGKLITCRKNKTK